MSRKAIPPRLYIPILLLLLPLFFNNCNTSTEKAPDVSAIKVDLRTTRFDLDFSAIDTNHIGQSLQKLQAKYPDFLNYYLDTFMAFNIHGNFADTNPMLDSMKPWLTAKDFAALIDTIKEHYPDTKDQDAQLSDAFRYMKHYFSTYHVPRIIYINAYLSKWPAFPLDSTTICVSLDHFLGEYFPFYAAVGIPGYMLPHNRKEYLPVSVFHQVYQSIYPFQKTDRTLLDLMIQHGKEQYFLHKIFPHLPDSVLFAIPQHKVDWCNQNEGLVYNFFTHERLIFSKESYSILPYVTDGPFAPNMPVADAQNNTPGNIGTWLGYKIVSSYMAMNTSVTLPQLLSEQKDANQFLEAAKYRPK